VTPRSPSGNFADGYGADAEVCSEGRRGLSIKPSGLDLSHHRSVQLWAALVLCLFLCARPSTIARLVVSVVVNAVNGVPGGWPVAHIGEECRERRAPPIADRDSSFAVARERRVIAVVAALNHLVPDAVDRVPANCSPAGESVFLRSPSVFALPAQGAFCWPALSSPKHRTAMRASNRNLVSHDYWLTSNYASSMPIRGQA
jgi:hypothetical protein